jgi:hypothetical protein
MPTRPIIEKTENLLEQIPDRLPLLTPPEATKSLHQKSVNIDLTQIPDK